MNVRTPGPLGIGSWPFLLSRTEASYPLLSAAATTSCIFQLQIALSFSAYLPTGRQAMRRVKSLKGSKHSCGIVGYNPVHRGYGGRYSGDSCGFATSPNDKNPAAIL